MERASTGDSRMERLVDELMPLRKCEAMCNTHMAVITYDYPYYQC